VLAFTRQNADVLTALGALAASLSFAVSVGMRYADLEKQLHGERELRASELATRDSALAKARELRVSEVARAKLAAELSSRATTSRWW
jgi:hypothetical protein